MNREIMNAYRFDRRLAGRRGWLSAEQAAAELAQLPDSADKVAPPEEAAEDASSEAAVEPVAPAVAGAPIEPAQA